MEQTTSDLRLRNWLYESKDSKFPMQVEGVGKDWIYLNFEGNEGDCFENTDKEIYPIPLTPEILENIGFVRHKLRGYDIHFDYLYKDCDDFKITALHDCDFSILIMDNAKGILYVHQLQNFYHVLTGKELEIRREWL